MTTEPDDDLLPALDEPPRTGWRHLEDAPLSDDEAAEGNALGEAIDVDDDADNGLDR